MPDNSEIARVLAGLGAATLGESGGRPMRARIKAAWTGAAVAAPAFPVQCTPADNLAVHVGVTRAARGAVLVVNVGDVRELGYWGEVLTTAAEARGLAGLVIDGCVRDVTALAAHGFPVFSPDSLTLHVMNESSNDMVSFDMRTLKPIGGRVPIGGASFGGGIRVLRK